MAIEISDQFPRYTDFDPAMPIWCVTPHEGGCMHRFFDTSPISPSGRYLAVLRLPYEDRLPSPGDAAQVVLVDLAAGEEKVLAETRGWEPQMGANIGWGADDHTLFFNDVDPSDWSAFAVRLDPLTGKSRRLGGTIYQASPDGRYLASANMIAMRRTQEGYGVMVPDELVPMNVGLRDDDGLFITDTETGERKLLLSIRQIVETAGGVPIDGLDDPDHTEVYGFHSKWTPAGDRLIFTLRWFPHTGEPQWGMISRNLRFTVFTVKPDGSELYAAVPASQWEKGGHHINFFPDGRKLSMNLNIDGEGLRFVECEPDGGNLRKILDDVPGSGHPTVHPDVPYIFTDEYAHAGLAFEDGTTPLRWVNMETGEDRMLARIPSLSPHQKTHGALRVDPHPAWDRTWRYVTFNGFVGGTRRVYIADMGELVS